jgi:AcrR family transcriptional regulator
MAKRPRKAPAAPPAEPRERLFEAALKLAALQGWADTSMADIAEEAGVGLAEARRLFPSKLHLLAGWIAHVDEQVLAPGIDDLADEPVRDRLFDLLMRRFDALKPHRKGLAAIARELARDPLSAGCLAAGPVRRSLEWTLAAARAEGSGPFAPLLVKGLGMVYLAGLRAFLRDESEDLSATMAALDKALNRAEAAVRWLPVGAPRRSDGAGAGAAEGPAA